MTSTQTKKKPKKFVYFFSKETDALAQRLKRSGISSKLANDNDYIENEQFPGKRKAFRRFHHFSL